MRLLRSVNGFTLAEVIVALGVLAVSILAIMGLLASNLSVQDKSQGSLAAVNLAESVMEKWKARPFQEVAYLEAHPPDVVEVASDGKDYLVKVRVKSLDKTVSGDVTGLRLLLVNVRLDWLESSGLGEGGTKFQRPAFFELESLVSSGVAL